MLRTLLLAILVLLPPAALAQGGREAKQWTVDGVEREALVFAPAKSLDTGAPVIFAFHGHGGTMRFAARSFHLHQLWPEAMVVYMQGLPTPSLLVDPEGKRNGWQRTVGDQGDRDLKFFDAVYDSLRKEKRIDERRVYVTGHSNGGAFTYLLWAARGERLTAVASSAAGAVRILRDLKPKPAMHLAGEADPLVKFAFQQRTMDSVRKTNGCDATGQEWAKHCTQYPSQGGTPFVAMIHPGDHKFPSEGPELIVKFFQECGPKR